MANELVEELTALFEGMRDRMNDWDILSAMGIADSFARHGNLDAPAAKFDSDGRPVNRDGLATVIVEMVGHLDVETSKKVRHEARWRFNEPYRRDAKMAEWRKARAERGSLDLPAGS